MGKKLTTEEFIEKAKKVHGDLFDYSEVVYEGRKTKVSIICKVHGIIRQTPNSHLCGRGCHLCAADNRNYNRRIGNSSRNGNRRSRHTFDTLSDIINNKHNCEIELVKGQTIEGVSKKYKFKHICGNEWTTTASAILRGSGCPKCHSRVPHNFTSLSKAVAAKHGDEIILIENQVVNGALHKYKFKHIVCGHEWYARANSIVTGAGRGCPLCTKTGFKTESVLISPEELLDFCTNYLQKQNCSYTLLFNR